MVQGVPRVVKDNAPQLRHLVRPIKLKPAQILQRVHAIPKRIDRDAVFKWQPFLLGTNHGRMVSKTFDVDQCTGPIDSEPIHNATVVGSSSSLNRFISLIRLFHRIVRQVAWCLFTYSSIAVNAVSPDRLADSTSTNSSTTPFTEVSGSSTTVIESMLHLGVVVGHQIQWLSPEITVWDAQGRKYQA